MSGLVFDIRHFSVHDGPGIRATVFLKGCPLKCTWCHNPESQLCEAETMETTQHLGGNKLIVNKLIVNKLVGNLMQVDEVMSELKKDTLIFDESKGGATFSGGEPMAQSEFLIELLKACKKLELHTAVDTSGFATESVIKRIARYSPLFLYDLKLANDKEHKHYTGVSNELILRNLATLIELEKEVFIRIPLIPSITDSTENLVELRKIIDKYPSIKRVDILPFHSIAKGKYERLGRKFNVNVNLNYSNERLAEIKAFFSEHVENVSIGG